MILLSIKAGFAAMVGSYHTSFDFRGEACIRLAQRLKRGNFESVVVKTKPIEFDPTIFVELNIVTGAAYTEIRQADSRTPIRDNSND